MQFRQEIIQEITDRLVQLGMTECPVCHGGSMAADSRPVMLQIGGLSSGEAPPSDPQANVLFMVRIVCDVCGYTMLIDSEKHRGPDEPVLVGH